MDSNSKKVTNNNITKDDNNFTERIQREDNNQKNYINDNDNNNYEINDSEKENLLKYIKDIIFSENEELKDNEINQYMFNIKDEDNSVTNNKSKKKIY